jgi:N-carbamoylputrescine amidase
MKVTATQLPDEPQALENAFADLAKHVKLEGSQLVLLPEMPFYPWMATTNKVNPAIWQAAVDAHEEWLPRLAALGADFVLGSRPVLDNGVPHNDAFIWQQDKGTRFAHRKYYLPDEDGFWEATWYRRADEPLFQAAQAGAAKVGFMICSDLWFGEHARGYARQGIHLLANPRGTPRGSVDKWLAGGRALAVMSGAYCVSSNRSGKSQGIEWGGTGWIIDPDGEVLATTSDAQPFVTVEIDLANAEGAKKTYPRDVKE